MWTGGYSLKRGVSSAGCECKVWSVEALLSEDELDFSRQAQHFGCIHLAFAWQARHFRRGLRQVVATCSLRGRRGTPYESHLTWQVQHLAQIPRAWNVILRGGQGI